MPPSRRLQLAYGLLPLLLGCGRGTSGVADGKGAPLFVLAGNDQAHLPVQFGRPCRRIEWEFTKVGGSSPNLSLEVRPMFGRADDPKTHVWFFEPASKNKTSKAVNLPSGRYDVQANTSGNFEVRFYDAP